MTKVMIPMAQTSTASSYTTDSMTSGAAEEEKEEGEKSET
jgi:hypothetical protein